MTGAFALGPSGQPGLSVWYGYATDTILLKLCITCIIPTTKHKVAESTIFSLSSALQPPDVSLVVNSFIMDPLMLVCDLPC